MSRRTRIVGLVLLCALVIGTPTAADEIRVARFEPTHSRATAYQINAEHNGIQTDQLTLPLHLLWKRHFRYPGYALVAGGKVFVATVAADGRSMVRAMDAGTGRVIWKRAAGTTGLVGAALGDGRVYVAMETPGFPSPGGRIRAYRASNGRLAWSTDVASEYSFTDPPVAAGRFVYAEAAEKIYALRSIDGSLAWTSEPMNAPGTAPTVSDRDVIAAQSGEETYAFDRRTGGLHWHHGYSTSCSVESDYAGAIHGNKVYAPNLILDLSTGREIGCYDSNYNPTFAPGLVFMIRTSEHNTDRRRLVAVRSSDGRVAWGFGGDHTIYMDLVDGGTLFAGSAHHLYAMRPASGRVLWSHRVPGGITHLTAGGGMILVSTLHALRAFA